MMLGMAHRGLENWNLASTEFYRVRSTVHPLKRWAAWYEAEADWQRGRPQSAIAECTQIRTDWPEVEQAEECLLLMADAWADSGKRAQATALFGQWMARHPSSPRIEEVKLRQAMAVTRASPAHGIPQLKKLVLDHTYHSSAQAAQAALDALGTDGHKVSIPSNTSTRLRRLASAQRCGRLEAAWDMFQELQADTDNPTAQRWTSANEERVAKRTRQWAHYSGLLDKRYEAHPTGQLAWQTFKAHRRAGQWKQAVALGDQATAEFGRRGRWASADDDLAWAEIHAGDYASAHKRWSKLAKGKGKFARHAAFYSAYCAYRSGQLEVAEAELGKVVQSTTTWRVQGYYWRSKVREDLGKHDEAEADRQAAIEVDREGWYTALIQQSGEQQSGERQSTHIHDGRWHGPADPSLPTWQRPSEQAMSSTMPWSRGPLSPPKTHTWPNGLADKAASLPPPAAAAPPALVSVPGRVEDGYVASKLYQPAEAAESFGRFANAKASIWPQLRAAHDLAQAGMVAEASVIVGKTYEEWKNPAKASPERRALIRTVKLPISTWRQYFALTRDHFHTAIASFGLGRKLKDKNESDDAYRLAYPFVEAPALSALGKQHNVDPLLMMGIMRQESTYRATIKSHAGAIGLVQVMPATGARLAWLMGDPTYSPGALAQPSVNIRYGTYYMSLLLDRFDGVYPMAIASYNGGPHNVSRWVRAHMGKIELDAWVEEVEWKETRAYVKRVIGHYVRYVDLYGTEGAVLRLPERPRSDDPSVVDF
jgi:soluble lytic murein transglycosylase-like protein/outer membrane protein assembly factor BamD (BamD/ComL family)